MKRALASAFLGSALLPVCASGGILLQADFDNTDPDVSYGYAYAQVGTPTGTGSEVATGGNLGTAGYQVDANLTTASGFYGGFGGGAIENSPDAISTPLAPADILYRIDLMANGLTGTGTNFRLEFQFRGPDNTIGSDPDANPDLIARIDVILPYTGPQGTYQSFAGSLAAGTFADSTTLSNFQQYGAQINNFQLNINIDGAFTEFGQDAGNIIGFDNILVSQGLIPEPGALGLLGIAGVTVLRRRRT